MAMLPPDPLFVIQKDWKSVMCVSIDDNKNKLFCGTVSGMIYVCSLETFRQEEEFKNGEVSVISLNLLQNPEDCLLVRDKAGAIRKWSKVDGTWTMLKEIFLDYLGFCRSQIDGDLLVTPSSQAALTIFSSCHLEQKAAFSLGDVESYGESLDCWKSPSYLEIKPILAVLKQILRIFREIHGFWEGLRMGFEIIRSVVGGILNSCWGLAIGMITVMAFSIFERSSKKYILAALESGYLTIIDFHDGQPRSEGLKLDECPMAIDFDSKSMRGIAGAASRNVTIFAVTPDMSIFSKRVLVLSSEGVASVSLREDRKLFALGCWDGRIRIFSWKTLVSLAVLDSHLQTINCLTFTSRSPYIMVAGCKEGKISLWDIYNAKR